MHLRWRLWNFEGICGGTQVFQSGGGIAEAACAAAYACAEDADWDLVQGMLAAACASQANSGAPDSKDWDGWQDADEEVEKSGGPDAKKELDEVCLLWKPAVCKQGGMVGPHISKARQCALLDDDGLSMLMVGGFGVALDRRCHWWQLPSCSRTWAPP